MWARRSSGGAEANTLCHRSVGFGSHPGGTWSQAGGPPRYGTKPAASSAASSGSFGSSDATLTWTSTTSLAARPGTDVEPMWSMKRAWSPNDVANRSRISANSSTQRSWYSTITGLVTGRILASVGGSLHVPERGGPMPTEAELKAQVSVLAERLEVPGVAVGVVDGDENHLAFAGVTSIEDPLPVDEGTLFQIGSTGKTYTSTAILRLVDEGKIDLDAPVRTHVPELTLKDEQVARDVT